MRADRLQVLHYFSRSPFFDATSNNAALTTQATHNASMAHIIATREVFEGTLKTMQGLEFVVSEDPSDNGHKIGNSGVWVIRKQIRRKRQGAEDEILPISLYFVVGENIYMAPSVGSVISNRMVCAGMITRADSKADTTAALCCHVCDQNTLKYVCVIDLHAFPWPYIPFTGPQEPRFCNQHTGESDEQRKYSDARYTRDKWQHQNTTRVKDDLRSRRLGFPNTCRILQLVSPLR